MPAYRTRDTRSLEVTVDAPVALAAPALHIVSPTPRAATFSFAPRAHTPSPSPANSPFEPDLRTFTLSPPAPAASPERLAPTDPASSLASPSGASALPPTHRRRRSTASDINERRPKKGDEDYIKRPENAFILFRRKCCEDRNAALGAAAADADDASPATPAAAPKRQRQADLSKAISAQWKALSPGEKQYWEDLARERKRAHAEQFPHYVYRPQRVKKGKAAAAAAASPSGAAASAPSSGKGKGKAHADDEPETEGEITFTLPLPAVPTRPGRRAHSAPTPPPVQQTIQIPTLYLPAQPMSPQAVPMISSRRSSVSDDGLDFNWTFPSPFEQPAQTPFKPEGWRPAAQEPDAAFGPLDVAHPIAFNTEKCAPALTISTDAMYMPTLSFSSSTATSSGPPSPRLGPYTPGGAIEALAVPAGADLWQSAPLHLAAADSAMRALEPTHTFSYQAYSWTPGVWASGGEPLFNEHFDLSMIPPIALDVPKFELGCGDHAAPAALHVGESGERDPFMQHFELDDALGALASGGDY